MTEDRPDAAVSASPALPLALPPGPDGPLLRSNPLPLPVLQRGAMDGPGGHIGRYVVLKEIGSGAMGVVLAAYDPDLERKVALKILRDRSREGSAGPVRMRREAQAMARLSHPNVAQVYEVGEDHDGRLFLVMEFVEGHTLREWQMTPRPWQEVLRVYGEAGRGLAAAHAAGLMHRDFKPDFARPSQPAPQPADRPHSHELGRFERVGVCRTTPVCPGPSQILANVWQRSRAVHVHRC